MYFKKSLFSIFTQSSKLGHPPWLCVFVSLCEFIIVLKQTQLGYSVTDFTHMTTSEALSQFLITNNKSLKRH